MYLKISIIGVGKVGDTLARLWHNAGYQIVTVYNRTPSKAENLAKQTGATIAATPKDAVTAADLICLTVSDDAIQPITAALSHADWQDKALIHTSGAASTDILDPVAKKGAMVGSLHPALPFADVHTAMQKVAGASFAIEASAAPLQQWLEHLVAAVSGNHIIIPPGKKALYHAALVITSNYTVTLYAVAQSLLASLSDDTTAIDNILQPLLTATCANIRQQGIPEALTGPLTRADVGTLQSHLNAIDDATLKQAYSALARLSFPMLHQRGIHTQQIEELLQEHT